MIQINNSKELIRFLMEQDQLTASQCVDIFNMYADGTTKAVAWQFMDASKDGTPAPSTSHGTAKATIIAWLERHGEKMDTQPGYQPSPLAVWV